MKFWLMDKKRLLTRLKEFMNTEAKSCSMDFGCITLFSCIACGVGLWHMTRLSVLWLV